MSCLMNAIGTTLNAQVAAERERDAAAADAERWRRLTGSSRVRVLGHAQLGRPDAHIGVEFWGEYRDASPEQSAEDVRELTTYADGLAARAARTGEATADE